MPDKTPMPITNPLEIELPQCIISEFARFLVPEMRKFYESEEGQRMFAEWQAEQEKKQ